MVESLEDEPWVGIDLGTCNSVIGLWQNNQVTILQTSSGSTFTPSVVGFKEDGSCIVGSSAVNLIEKYPKNTLYDAKRLIGRRFDEENVQNDIELWPFTVVEEQGRPMMVVNVNNEQIKLYPEQVSSQVLAKLKECAEAKCLREVKNAVVTVPAYFNDSQKQATKDACLMAGLECKRIINEPTAAAIAYGFDKARDEEKICLVYDFGGGTLDISILSIFRRKVVVQIVNGDTHVGGEDIDNILMIRCIQLIKDEHDVDLINDERAKARIRKACKEVKHQLTDQEQATLMIDSIQGELDFEYELSRAEFNELCSPLFERCMQPLRAAMEDSGHTKNEIDEIILVGGSTRIPKIQEMLQTFFDGKRLNKQLHPDEAVAYGATIQAGILAGSQQVADIQFKDVIPISIGINIRDQNDQRVMDAIITKNTTFPCSETKSYRDRGTGNVKILIIQGEQSQAVEQCHQISRMGLRGIPKNGQANVSFSIDENGILQVTATSADDQEKTAALTIQNDKLNLPADVLARLIQQGKQQRAMDQSKREKALSDYNAYQELSSGSTPPISQIVSAQVAVTGATEKTLNDQELKNAQRICEIQR